MNSAQQNNAQQNSADLAGIDVIILCGGLGKRLQSVISDRPKPMAEIEGKPFLQLLIEYFSTFGVKRFLLCAGYKDDVVREYFKDRYDDKEIVMSKEDTPLGTGGAVKYAVPLIKSDHFLVANGDSFCKLDVYDFHKFHILKKSLVSIALANVDNIERFGNVSVDTAERVTRFDEKSRSSQGGLINAGIYFMSKDIFTHLRDFNESFSLEYDLFPSLINKRLFGMKTNCKHFVDIGTPESYYNAQKLLSRVFINNS